MDLVEKSLFDIVSVRCERKKLIEI
jgi:hypothetical protein